MWILIPLIAASQSCLNYTCGTLSDGLCISSGNQVQFQPCKDPMFPYCPVTDFSTDSYCVPLPPSPFNSSFPGDSCTSNQTCVYSNCLHGVCQGLVASSVCSDTGQCSPGFRCALGKCKILLPLGAFDGDGIYLNCTVDSDCVNNGVCDNGNCFKYFSKDEAESVENCENGVSLICKSGVCYNGYCVSENMKADNSIYSPCYNDSGCVSSYYAKYPHNLKFFTSCECGLSKDGSKYCGLFPGDSPMKKFIKIFKEWMSSSEVKNCHSYSRYSLKCIEKYWSKDKFNTFAYYSLLVNNWRKMINVEDCVKKIVYYDYYSIDFEDSSYAELISVVLGLMIIV